MKFEWDEKKRLQNIRKHGIDFAGCEDAFIGYSLTIEDARYPYSEPRFITFGLLKNRLVAIAHEETEAVIRIISIRKATLYEQKLYFEDSPFPRIED